jgi:hypothetical protein
VFSEVADMHQKLSSSLNYAFESHRQTLTQLMEYISSIISWMDAIDGKTTLLRDEHNRYRAAVAQIPALWGE